MITSPWTDIDATTHAEPLAIRKPINIKRTMLDRCVLLDRDSALRVEIIEWVEGIIPNVTRTQTPEFTVDRTILVDSITRFEVIDEFGVDVGIGFVLGKVRQ